MSKKVSMRRRVSHRRDRELLNDILMLRLAGVFLPSVWASVYREELSPQALHETLLMPEQIEKLTGRAPALPVRALTPAPWRDISDLTRAIFIQRALTARGPCVGFALGLHHELIADATARGAGLVDVVHRRLVRRFPTSDFWFVMEKLPGKPPHIHGAIGIDAAGQQQEMVMRARLRRAGFEWRAEVRGKQAKIQQLFYPDGHAEYVAKSLAPWFTAEQNVGGGPSVTQDLNAAAVVLYENCRKLVTAARMRPKGELEVVSK